MNLERLPGMAIAEKPAVPHMKTRVNLDEVFGFVSENVVSDIVTPYKLILSDLIRLIQEIDPDESVLLREEAILAHSMLYGLINHEDMSFGDLKRCVRHLDLHVRKEVEIYDLFMFKMFAKQRGESKKVYFTDPSESRKKDGAPNRFSYKSPIQLFTQKLYVASCNQTQQEQFEMHQKIKEYIKGTWPLEITGPKETCGLPFEINTSIKSRQWLRKQMHLLQICPSEAMKEEQLLEWCEKIKKYHKDIPEVHLLEMISHVMHENFYKAEEALRRFFDLSVFRPNTTPVPPVLPPITARMGVADQRPFRYGPLVAARLHRVFGDREIARFLLHECLREAQSKGDNICHKMVCLEMSLLSSSQMGKTETMEERRSLRKTHNKDGAPVIDVVHSDKCCQSGDRDPEEHHHAVEMQLEAAMTLADAIERFRSGNLITFEYGSEVTECVSLDDKDAKSRLVHEAALATLSSFRMVQGLYTSARNTATALIESNGSDGTASHHETEAQAIANINLIYTDALEGNWSQALSEIQRLERLYPKTINWKCAKHILLAKSCLRFNNSLRQGKLDDCEAELPNMERFSYQEWLLKKTTLMALRDEIKNAASMLEKEEECLKSGKQDVYYTARVCIQAAVTNARLGKAYQHEEQLVLLPGILDKQQQKVVSLMVTRRLGFYYIMLGKLDLAVDQLTKAVNSTNYTLFEDAMSSLGFGYLQLKLGNPAGPEESEKFLERSVILLAKAGYPILVKNALKYKVELFELTGEEDEMMEALERFGQLDDEYPGFIDWLLL